ncbi:hypothetical protein AB833_19465 [Chromatiales bacterium (ex Bugula neritina AB1)]|nr:hypothetical protein AB833_19465 [Chromatiales bacterium (ex Bugula neritina AB1)]
MSLFDSVVPGLIAKAVEKHLWSDIEFHVGRDTYRLPGRAIWYDAFPERFGESRVVMQTVKLRLMIDNFILIKDKVDDAQIDVEVCGQGERFNIRSYEISDDGVVHLELKKIPKKARDEAEASRRKFRYP